MADETANRVNTNTADMATSEQEREMILSARQRGPLAVLGAYTRLSGPGWLQSAITLGGGSLGGALYLGVLGGLSFMWLQPLAMIMGVIMLSAIAFVTLSTGERPFQAINRNVSPVLGWGWAIATLMANLVWAMPQFSLGTAAVQQNLIPSLDGSGGSWAIGLFFLIVTSGVVFMYDKGSKGIKAFEIVLKVMVGIIVVSFFAVVFKMTMKGALDWGAIFSGLIPKPGMLFAPSATIQQAIDACAPEYREFWTGLWMDSLRKVVITAVATAVGINMTFLLPYSMLKKRWDKDFRGLAIFDLSTGLFIPFVLATGCVVIAAATQFHGAPDASYQNGQLVNPPASVTANAVKRVKADANFIASIDGLSAEEQKARIGEQVAALPAADKKMAALLVKRNADTLANSLKPVTGQFFAQKVFGIGVLGMAISTIIILMLINGFTVCEMLGLESKGAPYLIACLLPGLSGFAGAMLWGAAVPFWLVVPTSNFGMVLLPVAYFTFLLLMNNKRMLGDKLPSGNARLAWNLLMIIAAVLSGICSVYVLWSNLKYKGIALLVVFTLAALATRPRHNDAKV
ncbi:divalent metal cation transporter [Candidatus Sumerlaeota bacterium]|nr:divalent metal cation transporter [Candidatus Sumerlaeota bacterium]